MTLLATLSQFHRFTLGIAVVIVGVILFLGLLALEDLYADEEFFADRWEDLEGWQA